MSCGGPGRGLGGRVCWKRGVALMAPGGLEGTGAGLKEWQLGKIEFQDGRGG